MADDPKQSILSKYRVESLSDGIFAFAMTLLVLNIGIPAAEAVSINNEHARIMIASLMPSILHFVIAFMTIAAFWMSHHRTYDHVKRVDPTLLWLNTVCMMLIVLLPFSIEFVDSFNAVPISALVFECNILLVWAFVYMQAVYVRNNPHLLEKDAQPPGGLKLRTFIMPIMTFIAMGIALMGHDWSNGVYLLLPLVYKLTN